MESMRDAAMGFEAVKVSMSQDRNGVVLRLNVHPNDCPPELHTDWVGTRYMVAMVRLNDQDEPETREEHQRVERMIASAGLLCRNKEFGRYLYEAGLITNTNPSTMETDAINAVRDYCGIKSRADFRNDPDARQKFDTLREEFRQWKRS